MKELSIEEKACYYDEAVINGSRLWECGEITRENYEYIFPELKDEDERIRKELIKEINGLWENDSATWPSSLEKKNKYIAWLERQAQKPAAWSEEEEKNFKKAIKVLKVTNFHHTADMLQKMKYKLIQREETNNWKPNDEQMKALWEAYKGGEEQATLTSLYSDLKKLREE